MREEINCPKKREKKKGMVAFDLDHTLLDHNKGAITPSSLAAIQRLKENGYLVVLASGRNMYDRYSYDYLKEIAPHALVQMNGTKVLLDPLEKQEVLMHSVMSKDLLERLIRFGKEHRIALGTAIEDRDYFTEEEQVVQYDLNFVQESDRNFAPVEDLLNEEVSALCYCGGVEGAEALRKNFPELNVFPFSRDTGADLLEKGYSKAMGLEKIAEVYRIPREKTVAFGDSFNDEEMLLWANVGVAVGNAIPYIKEKADIVAKPIWEDGIYLTLKDLGLI